MNPSYITFDYALFQSQIPLYANTQQYPQSLVNMFWTTATFYVSDIGNFGVVQGAARAYAINLMTGHLLYIAGLVSQGTVPYLMQNSTIDKVTVGLTPPPLHNQWQWWLSTSAYGQQLLALLQVNSVGGFYIGGSAPRAAFGYQGGLIPFIGNG
jgi:hypothetical protein